jgi:hypothetical protein
LKAEPGTSVGRDGTRNAPPAVTRKPRNSMVKWSGTAMKLCSIVCKFDTVVSVDAENVPV